MKIERIHVENFKSIRNASIDFGDLNILIGRNAAGKSNLFELFQFLKDIGEQNLENAIQLRGGVEYFRNTRIRDSKNFKLTCSFSQPERRHGGRRRIGDVEYRISSVYSTEYSIEISFSGEDFAVEEEKIKNERTLWDTEDGIGDGNQIRETTSRAENVIERETEPINENEIDVETLESTGPRRKEISSKESLLSLGGYPRRNFMPGLRRLKDLVIYDVDPGKIKKGTTLKGKRELEPNGENLPLVLKEIVSSDDKEKKFLNIAGDVLPFLKDWRTDTLSDKSVFLKILEEFEDTDEEYLPANLVSDGTINMIVLVVILYFENRGPIFIEEPEKSIHPSLISKMMDMMVDSSVNSDKQIFVTSHNVELVKNANLEQICLVARDHDGYTEISRPDNDSHIREFLSEGMGLGELYVNNILEDEL